MNKDRSQWKYTTVGGLQEFPTMQKPPISMLDNPPESQTFKTYPILQAKYMEHIAGLRNIPANLCFNFTSEDEGKEFSENEVEIVYQFLSIPDSERLWMACSKKEYDLTDHKYRRIVATKKDEDREIESLVSLITKYSSLYYAEAEDLAEQILSTYIIKRR